MIVREPLTNYSSRLEDIYHLAPKEPKNELERWIMIRRFYLLIAMYLKSTIGFVTFNILLHTTDNIGLVLE